MLRGNNIQKGFRRKPVIVGPVTIVPGTVGNPWSKTGDVEAGEGFIQIEEPSAAWDKGGSFGVIPANTPFTLVFTMMSLDASVIGSAMMGVGVSDPDGGYISIDYAVQFSSTGTNDKNVYCRHNGTYTQTGSGTTGFDYNDRGVIERDASGIIRMYQNGVKIYQHGSTDQRAFLVDSSLNNNIGFEQIELTV